LKILEVSDDLDRTVKIRAKWDAKENLTAD
jgi:hypothetical protein